jgi:hypothetical protein
MEAENFSETSVNIYDNTRRHISNDIGLQSHLYDYLKFHMFVAV